MRRPLLSAVFLAAGLFLPRLPLRAADEKEKKDQGPTVTALSPLVVTPGTKATVRVRGVGLDGATGVRFPDVKDDAKAKPLAAVKSKGKAEVSPRFEAKTVGDTQVEVELTLPADLPAGPLALVVVTPKGETGPQTVTVMVAEAFVEEKEPNGSFREAQALEPGNLVVGTIASDGDVDVFKLTGKAGDKVSAEVTAARAGSLLDALLTLYDAAGHVLAQADDTPESRDAVLTATLPADGTYFLSLTDANDHGSATHGYRLSVGVAGK